MFILLISDSVPSGHTSPILSTLRTTALYHIHVFPFVFLCVVYMHACACVYVQACGGPRMMKGLSFNCSALFMLRWALSIELRAHSNSSPAAPSTQSPLSEHWITDRLLCSLELELFLGIQAPVLILAACVANTSSAKPSLQPFYFLNIYISHICDIM